MKSTRQTLSLLITFAFLAPLRAQDRSIVDQLLDRIVRQEQQFLESLKKRSPIVETYIQELPESDQGDSAPSKDHYFLGRLNLTGSVNYDPLVSRTDRQKTSRLLFFKTSNNKSVSFIPRGFAQMAILDADRFDRNTYTFEFVRREFQGDVRCLVFDISPIEPDVPGRFLGRMWVEDQAFHIVRFNGTYTKPKNLKAASRRELLYFHFDSWRVNVAPEVWVPAYIYVEESAPDQDVIRSRFKAQTRIWDYNPVAGNRLDELTSILIDDKAPVKDESGSTDVSPLESQRSWEHQAEVNILDRLEKAGLIAPKGSVDQVLDTVVNNLIVTNNLTIDAHCRVLLTTPLETFSIGHTIVISRGLLDVLPDEASLAMVLADELAHIALGHRTQTQFAFYNQTMLSDEETLQRFRFQRSPDEIADAGKKTIELMQNSPYKKLANAGLFLKALNNRSPHLPKLIQANLGNQLASGETLLRLSGFVSQAPPLEEDKLEQIAALPLGSRIKVDPWSNQITMLKNKPVSLLSAREKMPFEVTPFVIHLVRVDAPAETGRP